MTGDPEGAEPAAPTGLPRSTTLRIRLTASFLYRFLNTMVVPFMTIYLAITLGAVTAGLLMVVVSVAAAVAALLGGPACDRFGRRPILILGEFGTGAGFLGTALATWSAVDLPVLAYGLFLVATTLSALALPAHDATIVDVTTPASRRAYYTVNYWLVNVGIGAGSLLGGLLFDSYFPVVLLAAGTMLVGLGLLTTLLLPETLPGQVREAARRRGFDTLGVRDAYLVVLRDPRYRALVGAATLAISIELQLTNYLAVRLARDLPRQPLVPGLGLGGEVTGRQLLGLLRLENTLLVVALTLALAPAFRRLSDRVRLLGGLSVFTLGYAVLAVSNAAWVLLLAVAVLTAGELLNVPVKQALIANSVRDDARGSYLAAYNLTGNAGWVVATVCISLGALLRPAGMAVLYLLCGAVAVRVFAARLRPDGAATPAEAG